MAKKLKRKPTRKVSKVKVEKIVHSPFLAIITILTLALMVVGSFFLATQNVKMTTTPENPPALNTSK